MGNKLAIISFLVLLASVPLIVHMVSAGSIFALSDEAMLDEDEFEYGWGPGDFTRSDYPGPGVLFSFTGLTDSGTAVHDNYPVSPASGGGDLSGYSKFRVYFTNLGTEGITACLKINTGWTSEDWRRDTYWQSEWTYIPADGHAWPVVLDFSSCPEAWNIADDPEYPGYTDGAQDPPVAIWRLDEVSQIGFQVLGDGDATIVVSSEPPTGSSVIPEVPLGTIVASAAMIITLVAYVAMPKFRKKQININP